MEEYIEALKDLIVAAEIIDGQDHPPSVSDVDYLHGAIAVARELLNREIKREDNMDDDSFECDVCGKHRD